MSARASIIPVFVPHLGCPHACVFCNQRRISGAQRAATAEDVKKSIEQAAAFLPKGGKRQLAFYGGSFTAIPAEEQEALLTAAKEALDRGGIDAIRLSTRPDAIDDAVLARLQRFGVETVELGAQSMDDEVLRLSGRGHTATDVERASKQVQAAGFRLILQMMTGLPGSTDEKDVETARRIIALRPDGVRIYPTVIVRDTALCDMWRAGKYREHTVEDAVRVCAEILPLFETAEIPVIRLGLNPTDELSNGAAVAGAYHPALGELVKSRILLNRARELLRGVEPGSRVTLSVGKGKTSQMTGQHRENIRRLTGEFGLAELKIRENPELNGEILLFSVEKRA
jgi:histone acetyltransferase (RNA polymerase elongator complex component)